MVTRLQRKRGNRAQDKECKASTIPGEENTSPTSLATRSSCGVKGSPRDNELAVFNGI